MIRIIMYLNEKTMKTMSYIGCFDIIASAVSLIKKNQSEGSGKALGSGKHVDLLVFVESDGKLSCVNKVSVFLLP